MNNQFSPELLEKAKSAKSASELITLAKENGITLTEEAANTFYEKLNSKTGEISDEELDNVSGGGCYDHGSLIVSPNYTCQYFETRYVDTPQTCKYCTYSAPESATLLFCRNNKNDDPNYVAPRRYL